MKRNQTRESQRLLYTTSDTHIKRSFNSFFVCSVCITINLWEDITRLLLLIPEYLL